MTIIIFILVLGLLVLVHETGHFIAAKKAGCDVEEFGIGFPPRLFKVKKGGTLYTINALPLGGYVKIKGEDGGDVNDPGSFASKKFGWKALIIISGVTMNVLLAYFLISIGLVLGTPTVITDESSFGRFAKVGISEIQIIEVLNDSPADRAGIKRGDILLSIGDQNILETDDLSQALNESGNNLFKLDVKRGQENLSFDVKPIPINGVDGVGIGVGLAKTADVSYQWYMAWWYGAKRTVLLLIMIVQAFAELLVRLVTGAGIGSDIAGPIGIAVLTGEVAKLGLVYLFSFTALLSLNLAIINILPFPALDGSRLLFLAIEKIRRKQMNQRIERKIHFVGFGLLMILMLMVTIKDIGTYGAGIWRIINSIFT